MKRNWIEDDEGCWVWLGAFQNGRALVYERGRMRGAARVIYEKEKGFWLDRRTSLKRTCGNPKCVNPAHGVLKTNHEVSKHFFENYAPRKRRKQRETVDQKIERLEADRKAFKPILKKR